MVTLTATVQAGATALTLGEMNFCDTAANTCTDIHLLGTAQLTSAGTAVLRFRPGPGSHSYKAVFLGTLAGAASSSAAVGLTVGPRPPGLQTTYTVASIAGPDATNMYALTASVGTKGAISPSCARREGAGRGTSPCCPAGVSRPQSSLPGICSIASPSGLKQE